MVCILPLVCEVPVVKSVASSCCPGSSCNSSFSTFFLLHFALFISRKDKLEYCIKAWCKKTSHFKLIGLNFASS